jgi:hypothetical protein
MRWAGSTDEELKDADRRSLAMPDEFKHGLQRAGEVGMGGSWACHHRYLQHVG